MIVTITTLVLILVSIVLMIYLKSLFIPGLFIIAAAVILIIWLTIKLLKDQENKKIFDIKLFAPFISALSFIVFFMYVVLVVRAGLGHGGRASAVLPMQALLVIIIVVLCPVSAVVLYRYYKLSATGNIAKVKKASLIVTCIITAAIIAILANIAGWPPIIFAARKNYRDMGKKLIAMGVNVNVQDRHNDYWTPLNYASSRGDLEMVTLLLKHGAEIYDKKWGTWPALIQASAQGHTEVVKLLAEKITDPQAFVAALYTAASCGQTEVVKYLIEKGSDPTQKNRGRTAFDGACMSGHSGVIKILLQSSAAVNVKFENCGKALIDATAHGDIGMMKLLLDKGVDVNSPGDFQQTALITAAEKDSPDMVKFLLGKGAKVNSRDLQGRTALTYAMKGGNKAIIEVLQEHGAKE